MARREIPEINAGSMADIAFLLLIFFLVTTTIQTPEAGQPQELPVKQDDPDRLPPDPPPKVLDWNVLFVKANKEDQLLIDKEYILPNDRIDELYDMTVKFYGDHTSDRVINEDGDEFPDYPVRVPVNARTIAKEIDSLELELEKYKLNDLPLDYPKAMLQKAKDKKKVYLAIGEYYEFPKNTLIKFESDNGTSYGYYLKVMDQMKSAWEDVKNEYTQSQWGVDYDELDPDKDADKIMIVDFLYPNKIIDSSDRD